MVFHRILDFKTRLDFYPASIFLTPSLITHVELLLYLPAPELQFSTLIISSLHFCEEAH
jgi:hypothetical protein